LALAVSFSTSWNHFAGPGSDEEIAYFLAACAGYVCSILALAGSIISHPRFFAIGAVIVGTAFVFSFYGYYGYVSSVGFALKLILMVLPGLALIGGGIVQIKGSNN